MIAGGFSMLVAEDLDRERNEGPVRVIAVTSGKGGVGKTTVSINLAIAFSLLGRRTVLLDGDLGLANIDVMLGLKPVRNLAHVIDGDCELPEVLLRGPGGISIVPAASGISRMTELSAGQQAGLVNAFSALGEHTDCLVIDTAAGISMSTVALCSAAREIVVVVCNEPASITDAYATIKVLNLEHDIRRFRVLVNMAHGAQEGFKIFNRLLSVTERFLDVSLDLIATIPYDFNLRKVMQRQRALVDVFPECKSSQAFINLAKKWDKWPIPRDANGKLEFFLEKMVQASSDKRWLRV